MGAGDGIVASCDRPAASNGIFQYTPRGTCTATGLDTGATFISDIGGVRNYTGRLENVFTCIAALGETGCGFEHQFAAVPRALGADGRPAPAENQGFLRPDAYLAIVLVTNEDDCSASPGVPLYDTGSQHRHRVAARPAGELPLQRVRPHVQTARAPRPPEPTRPART